MSDKRPTRYRQWREMWDQTSGELGRVTHSYWNANSDLARRGLRKYQYELLRRMDRIKKQLDAEWDARTSGAMNALLEMIFKNKAGS